jgi:hypothetical protein
MPLDPSIILQNIYPKFEPRENILAKQMQLKAAQQEYDQNAYKMQTERDSQSQQNALAQLLGRQGFNAQTPEGQAELYRTGGVKGAQGYLKSAAEEGKTRAETDKVTVELADKKFALARNMLNTVQTPEQAQMWLKGAFTDPHVGPLIQQFSTYEDAVSRIGKDPQSFAQWKAQASLTADKLQDKLHQDIVTAETGRHNLAGERISVENNAANNATSRANNAATVGASYSNAAATRAVAASNVEAARMRRDQDTEMKLGDDYRAQSKDFKSVGDAYKQINATLDSATKSPAATLAAATKFMKLLDPGSVVRESELGMALAASGVIDRATNYVNTLQRGKVLTANQVKDFKNITEQIYNAAQAGQKAIDKDYTNKATAYKLRPEMIVQDLGQNAAPKTNGTSNIDALLNKYK